MKEDLLKIIEHYSPTHQLKKLSEEVYELQESVLEYHHEEYKYYPEIEKKLKEHIVEEIADVMVLLNQFIHYYGIEEIDILKVMKYKVDRQMERMKNDNN